MAQDDQTDRRTSFEQWAYFGTPSLARTLARVAIALALLVGFCLYLLLILTAPEPWIVPPATTVVGIPIGLALWFWWRRQDARR